jgi:signal transduction histidine kinase
MINAQGREDTMLELAVQKAEEQLLSLQAQAARSEDAKLVAAVKALCATLRELRTASDQVRQRQDAVTHARRHRAQSRLSREQLRALARRQQAIQEQERTALARELHDEFGAALTALKLDLHWIMARLPPGLKSLQDRGKRMSELIDRTVESVSRTGALLRPRVLDDFGLVAGIEWQTREFERRTGIHCRTSLPEQAELDPKLSTAIFRIFQEALTNVARHAQATEVSVNLRVDGNGVFLEVKDNGVGISQDQLSSETSFGLLGMQERAYAFGGEICFEGGANQGTTVRLQIPFTTDGC